MRVLVFGAGAVGSVLGGLLAKNDGDVTFLGRAEHLDGIRKHGLRITGLWGEHAVHNIRTVTSAAGLFSDWDWIFVCVKSYQTQQAAEALPPLLGAKTCVCAFQNGLGNYEALLSCVPADRLALGRVIFGAQQHPGQVRVTVCADDVLIGAPSERFPQQMLSALANALQKSGIPARTEKAIITALWGKVLYNCALNPLSMLLEVPYGRLLEGEDTRRIMQRVVEEAYAVAKQHGVALVPPTAEAYHALLLTKLIPDTAAHNASMLQDIQRGRRTEIDALNGAVVRLGEEKSVATPVNALLTRLVYAKEKLVGVR